MLELNKSVIVSTKLMEVHSSLITLEEGTALIGVLEGGKIKASPSTGAAGEKFVGIAQNRFVTPNFANGTLSTSVPGTAPYTIALAKTPTANADVSVTIAGSLATQGTPAAGVYSVAGNVLTFAAADAGKSIDILFRYALTQVEANNLFGSDIVSASLTPGVETSVIDTGTIFTDMFVIGDDWSSNGTIYLGAGGKFTMATGGTATDAIVAELPSVAGGFLGLILHP